MSTSENIPRLATVKRGSKAGCFFIPISNVPREADYKDVWDHLKRRSVKGSHLTNLTEGIPSIEHIEIYPGGTKGWICVKKFANFKKVISALQAPVYTRSTGESGIILASDKNNYQSITIRIARQYSDHMSTIINEATIDTRPDPLYKADGGAPDTTPPTSPTPPTPPTPTSPTSPTADKPKKVYEGIVNGTNWNQKPAIINGTYKPSDEDAGAGCASPISHASSDTFQSSETSVTTCSYYYWDSGTLYHHYYTQPVVDLPPPPKYHTVSLSNFHSRVTIRQVQDFVRRVSKYLYLEDRDFHFIDGTTIATSNKRDARRFRKALSGSQLRGLTIKTRRSFEYGPYPNVSVPPFWH
ncbi:hypothetical protein NUW58_g6189 [Xylaria curta]|uniref:Uncharacterized protein n=1 Tax=Xylaria curta TaxID=42375 RepID=A0ACC1NZ71_9PEZI|nr:hypothetical protein NUW58_g6189 [Xylaria curta]